jgi:uncharacterized protein
LAKIKEDKIFPITDKSKFTKKTQDGFQNFQARLGVDPGRGAEGTEDNLLSKGHYEFNLVTRNRVQLEAAYRGSWIVGQVIDTVAEDMTRGGITCTTNEDAEVIPDLMAEMTKLQILSSFRETVQWGRLYGGAVGVMQINGQDLKSPLKAKTVGKGDFKGMTVYDRWQIWPVLTDLIVSGPNMGLPAYYDIVLGTNLNDPGMEPGGGHTDEASGRVRVHHSRCFRMDGIKLPYFQAITEMLWGESVLERMWDRLIAFDDATMNAGNLIHRANLRRVGVEGLREILAAGGEAQEALIEQFNMMREFQSNEYVTLTDKLDDYTDTSYSFAGLSDMLIQFGQQVSGSAQIPLVRLFGQSPAGMNSTGESDLRMYYDGILAKQESRMRNPMHTVLQVLWRSMTGQPLPDDFNFKFVPLWQLSALDKANVAKVTTDTILEAHSSGGIDSATMMQELKQTSAETGLFTHITDEHIQEAENEEPPLPDIQDPNKADGVGEPGNGPEIPSDKVKKGSGAKAVADAVRNL